MKEPLRLWEYLSLTSRPDDLSSDLESLTLRVAYTLYAE